MMHLFRLSTTCTRNIEPCHRESAIFQSSSSTARGSCLRREIFRFLIKGAGGLLIPCLVGRPSEARIPTEAFTTFDRLPQMPSPEELIGARKAKSSFSSTTIPSARMDIKESVAKIQQWTAEAEENAKELNFSKSLSLYDQIISTFPDLAITEYARLHRALCLYELGGINRCLLELNDLEVSLRGNPEVHASLAVVLYSERPLQRIRAEEQWDLALEFDQRYSNVEWVEKSKKWGPKMMQALNQFLLLK